MLIQLYIIETAEVAVLHLTHSAPSQNLPLKTVFLLLKMFFFVCVQYSRLSKQYGMEIYLKKEQLHYTGSVKERGVLYLLTCLTQVSETRKGGGMIPTCLSGHGWCDLLPVCPCRHSCVNWPLLLTCSDRNSLSAAWLDSGMALQVCAVGLRASESVFSPEFQSLSTVWTDYQQIFATVFLGLSYFRFEHRHEKWLYPLQ